MVDVIGSTAVQNMIAQSGLSRFTINRTGTQKGTISVYEYLKGGNVSGTVDAFQRWAATVQAGGDNGNEYEILLFEEVEDANADETEVKRTKKKSGKMRFTFQLSNRSSMGVINGVQERSQNVSEVVELAVRAALAERDKADLLAKMEALEKRLNEMEEEEDEEEEKQPEQMAGLLGTLMPLITGKKQNVVVNGVDSPEPTKVKVSPEQMQNINKAVTLLFKYDEQLDTDLLKLAAIAQSNPQQFQFLLNALRNM